MADTRLAIVTDTSIVAMRIPGSTTRILEGSKKPHIVNTYKDTERCQNIFDLEVMSIEIPDDNSALGLPTTEEEKGFGIAGWDSQPLDDRLPIVGYYKRISQSGQGNGWHNFPT